MTQIYYSKLASLYPQKRAIVTGAGSGLGFEIVQLLIHDGWKVLAIDIYVLNLQKIQYQDITIVELDVTSRVELEETLNKFCSLHEGIDLLFNNAGVGEGASFEEYSLNNWDWIIDINLKSVIASTHFVLPFMIRQNKGMIINIASMAGVANLPKMSPYNVTKAAVISLSETLAHEVSKTNIRVKCITPTFFQSSILQHSKGNKEVLKSAAKLVTGASLTSNDVAKLILKNLETARETFRFPLTASVLYYFKKWLPRVYTFLVRRYLV